MFGQLEIGIQKTQLYQNDEYSNYYRIKKKINTRIDEKTNLIWTKYNSSSEIKSELKTDIKDFENGSLEKLEKYRLYFVPTGTFQEISIPNGWGEEFILLANQFDEIYEKIKAST